MAHNSLRRAIVDYLSGTPKDYGTGLLQRALDALGGLVENNRPGLPLQIIPRPFTPAEINALDSYKGEFSDQFGTPGCPPVDAVSTKETGADCTRSYASDEQADRETIELINRRRLHGFTELDRLHADDDVPELRYDYLHREPTEDDDA